MNGTAIQMALPEIVSHARPDVTAAHCPGLGIHNPLSSLGAVRLAVALDLALDLNLAARSQVPELLHRRGDGHGAAAAHKVDDHLVDVRGGQQCPWLLRPLLLLLLNQFPPLLLLLRLQFRLLLTLPPNQFPPLPLLPLSQFALLIPDWRRRLNLDTLPLKHLLQHPGLLVAGAPVPDRPSHVH